MATLISDYQLAMTLQRPMQTKLLKMQSFNTMSAPVALAARGCLVMLSRCQRGESESGITRTKNMNDKGCSRSFAYLQAIPLVTRQLCLFLCVSCCFGCFVFLFSLFPLLSFSLSLSIHLSLWPPPPDQSKLVATATSWPETACRRTHQRWASPTHLPQWRPPNI